MKRIVLCRPGGPRNVGSVLRAALNFGAAEIVITSPARPSLLIHPDFALMSHGGEEARDMIRVVDTLEEALEGTHHAVAFTGRTRKKTKRVDWRERAPDLRVIGDSEEQTLALIFGNEETGLTKEECDLAQELVHFRTAAEHTSLNLAQAVVVALYSLFTGTEVHEYEPEPKRVDGQGRAFLKARMKEVLAGEVARTESAATDITSMIDRMMTRTPLEPRDARAWHLILNALGSRSEPADFGLGGQEKGARRRDALERRRAQEGDAGEEGGGSEEP